MMQSAAGVGPPSIPQTDQQQWMMMQQQTMQQVMAQPIAQSYVHPHHHVPQSHEEVRTLWIGDLQYWMDENYLRSCFYHVGEVISVKVIRNKQTLVSEGYGFIEFSSHAAAETILQTFNGTLMPQTEQAFRLNWASFGAGERRGPDGDHSIFVGDLAADVNDYLLQETFRSRYPSVASAKVVMDAITGRSKGYGFVKFGDENEKARAMSEMNGVYCSSRPMRIAVATPKRFLLAQQATQKASPAGAAATAYQAPAPRNTPAQSQSYDTDPNNTTIFVGGLNSSVSEEELRQAFGQFGDLVYVRIPHGKGCGFVQFAQRSCAEEALQKLHGTVIGQQTVRLSWGRSLNNNRQGQQGGWGQSQQDPNQWNAGYYGYGQGYEAYGYAPPQDAGSYVYGAYPAYANYPQQVVGNQQM